MAPSAEAAEGGSFVRMYVENGIELGDLQQVVDFLGEVQELELAAAILDGGVSADEFADPRAVNVIHVGQIQQNVQAPFLEQRVERLAQERAAVAERDAPAHIHNSDRAG